MLVNEFEIVENFLENAIMTYTQNIFFWPDVIDFQGFYLKNLLKIFKG